MICWIAARLAPASRSATSTLYFLGQFNVLERVAKSAGVVVLTEVVEPCFLVYALAHLKEDGQIVRSQIEGLLGPRKWKLLSLPSSPFEYFLMWRRCSQP